MMTQYQSNMNVTSEPSEDLLAIVGAQYCAPYQMDLTVERLNAFASADKYVVKDDINNIFFNVKQVSSSLHNKKVIFDAAGNPILTLYCKIFSVHRTWKAFRGESSDDKDLIFTAKSTSFLEPTTLFKVYKANNSSQNVPDIKVKGKWLDRSVAMYAGESSTIVAQVRNSLKDLTFSRNKTVVTVRSNIDCAFVAAMVILLETLE